MKTICEYCRDEYFVSSDSRFDGHHELLHKKVCPVFHSDTLSDDDLFARYARSDFQSEAFEIFQTEIVRRVRGELVKHEG